MPMRGVIKAHYVNKIIVQCYIMYYCYLALYNRLTFNESAADILVCRGNTGSIPVSTPIGRLLLARGIFCDT
jgi:hypothetical protein